MKLGDKIERSEIIVCDWDGVMQLIEPKWMAGVISNRHVFEGYFNDNAFKDISLETIEEYKQRDVYYLNKYYKRDDVEYNEEIEEFFMRIYLEDEEFYDDIPLTHFGRSLLRLTVLEGIQEIVFLSHTPYKDKDDKRKERVLMNYMEGKGFDKSKVSFVSLNENEKKCEWIKKNKPDYTAFIDDRADIVKSVIESTDNYSKTYMMPLFGYNDINKLPEFEEHTTLLTPYMVCNYENDL